MDMEGGGMQMGLGSVLGALAMGGMVLFVGRATRSTHCCNGTGAIATLRNLGNVQEQFQKSGSVDVDGDGRGEYGTIAELTGSSGLRADPRGIRRGAVLSPAVLSPSLSRSSAVGDVTKAGFHFRVYLPAEGDGAAHEGWPGAPLTAPVDSAEASRSWGAYAWPAYKPSGSIRGCRRHYRTYYADGTGSIWYVEGSYWGPTGGPDWDAAMPWDGKGQTFSVAPEDVNEVVGRDGRTWKRE